MKTWRELKTSELNSLTVGTEVKINNVETVVTELQESSHGYVYNVIGFDTEDPIVETNPTTFWGINTHRETIYVLSEEV